MKTAIWIVAFAMVAFVGYLIGGVAKKAPVTTNECLGRIVTSASNETSYDLCPELSDNDKALVMEQLSDYLKRGI
ncbi:MAG TPA: hypothetical protein VLT90_12915 [Terriglobales bacterium]|nr:hypothetical protein [Terriglobales bacterium]